VPAAGEGLNGATLIVAVGEGATVTVGSGLTVVVGEVVGAPVRVQPAIVNIRVRAVTEANNFSFITFPPAV